MGQAQFWVEGAVSVHYFHKYFNAHSMLGIVLGSKGTAEKET